MVQGAHLAQHPVMPAGREGGIGVAHYSSRPLVAKVENGGIGRQYLDVGKRLGPPEVKRAGVQLAGRAQLAGRMGVLCMGGQLAEFHLVKLVGGDAEPVTGTRSDQ